MYCASNVIVEAIEQLAFYSPIVDLQFYYAQYTESIIRKIAIEKLENGSSLRRVAADLNLSVGNVSRIKNKYDSIAI